MLYYKRRKRKYAKFKRILIITVSFFIAAIIFCEYQINDFKPGYVRRKAEVLSAEAICTAVEYVLENNDYAYGDLVKLNCDSQGAVKSIESNSSEINKIKAFVLDKLTEEISKIHSNEIDIPLGVFTNITVLSNVGPAINVNFNITGSFNAEIISTFESAGVNQTVHHISIMITSKIITTSLDYSGDITFNTDFEIAQTVIVGDIPNYYGRTYSTY